MTEQEIIEKYTKVCTCRSVSKRQIKQAMEEGCTTLQEVCKKTGAGRGACKGKRCGPKIKELIASHKDK